MTLQSERTLGGLLRAKALARGDDLFVHYKGRDVSFAALDELATRAAHGFARLGIRSGERVCLALPNGIDFLVVWFALARLGAIEVPVNLEFKPHQVRYVLDDAQAGVLVTDDSFLAGLEGHLQPSEYLRTLVLVGEGGSEEAGTIGALQRRRMSELLQPHDADAELPEVRPSDPTAIIYTSGTTGHPKGVLLCHEHQLTIADNIGASLSLGPDDCFYNFFPLHHNTSQGVITCAALAAESRMLLVDRFSRSMFWSDVKTHGCTRFYAMGSLIEILNKDPDGPTAAHGHPLKTSWGIAIGVEQARRFAELYGVDFVTGYGSTEINMVSMTSESDPRPGSSGPIVETDFEVRIADEDDVEVPQGTVGEILVRPHRPYVTSLGYWNKPEATVAYWRNLWMHTGDAGRFDSDGHLHFVDRIKDVIRSRGNSVASAEVEGVISVMDCVAEVAVIPGPSDLGDFDQDVYALIVPVAGAILDPAAIVAHCANNLAYYAVPRYIEFVDELPKTPTAKVQKKKLRERGLGVKAWDRIAAGIEVRSQHAQSVKTSVEGDNR